MGTDRKPLPASSQNRPRRKRSPENERLFPLDTQDQRPLAGPPGRVRAVEQCAERGGAAGGVAEGVAAYFFAFREDGQELCGDDQDGLYPPLADPGRALSVVRQSLARWIAPQGQGPSVMPPSRAPQEAPLDMALLPVCSGGQWLGHQPWIPRRRSQVVAGAFRSCRSMRMQSPRMYQGASKGARHFLTKLPVVLAEAGLLHIESLNRSTSARRRAFSFPHSPLRAITERSCCSSLAARWARWSWSQSHPGSRAS